LAEVTSAPRSIWRFAPLVILALALVLALALRLDRYISLDTLRDQRAALDAFVVRNIAAALAIYLAAYVAAVAISLPVSIYLTLAGGYLFGLWLGGGAAWVGATIGATCLFLAARTALGDALRRIAGPWMARFEAGFRDNAFNYLLVLRFIPALPFWVVNLVPSFFSVKLRDYVAATAIGIVPATFVIASVGAALHEALEAGATLDPAAAVRHLLFSPLVLGAMAGMIALSLLPVAVKILRKERSA
jgi:uncharacterized membrane protein YdjX (TVP38/TMEM64 family)